MAAAVSLLLILVLGLLLHGRVNADDVSAGGNNVDSNGADMVKDELLGLFEVMGSLLEDPSWAQTYPSPCTATPWPGVECELDQETSTFHVTKIRLGPDVVAPPPCKADAKISDSILRLPYLKSLSLTSCFTVSPATLSTAVFGRPPSSSSTLSYLQHLTLESNPSLSGEIPPSLSELAALETLRLSQNNLSGAVPRELFAKLANLKELDLSHNMLVGSIPEEIRSLEKLAVLDMSYNHLQETVPSSITELQFLEKADLSYNELRGCLPQNLGNLRRLVLLDMSCNNLTGPFPGSLAGLKQLQYLIMDHNPLNESFPSSLLGSLAQLTVISLSECGLRGPITTASFSNLKKLKALFLQSNELNGSVPQELGMLTNLDTLNLSRNQFSGDLTFSQEFIDRLGTRLDVRGNSGLCAVQVAMEDGQNSRFLKNKTIRSPDSSKALYNGNMNSSSSNACCDRNQLMIIARFAMFFLLMFEFAFGV